MGWVSDEVPGHDGYLVGLERVGEDWPQWRELGSSDDPRGEVPLEMIQIACDCGWRSMRIRAPLGSVWSSGVALGKYEQFENACVALWREHTKVPDLIASRAERRLRLAVAGSKGPSSDAGPRGGRLELVDELGGPRHYLEGQPVHAGAPLELLREDGTWLRGRYENQPVGQDELVARFCVSVPCKTVSPDWSGARDGTAYPEAMLTLPPDARLRWPER